MPTAARARPVAGQILWRGFKANIDRRKAWRTDRLIQSRGATGLIAPCSLGETIHHVRATSFAPDRAHTPRPGRVMVGMSEEHSHANRVTRDCKDPLALPREDKPPKLPVCCPHNRPSADQLGRTAPPVACGPCQPDSRGWTTAHAYPPAAAQQGTFPCVVVPVRTAGQSHPTSTGIRATPAF